MSAQGLPPSPFSAAQSLQQLQRALRDCKLNARGQTFELRGLPVVELKIQDAAIAVRLARRLMSTPEWDSLVVKSAVDQRKLLDEVKKRLSRWQEDD